MYSDNFHSLIFYFPPNFCLWVCCSDCIVDFSFFCVCVFSFTFNINIWLSKYSAFSYWLLLFLSFSQLPVLPSTLRCEFSFIFIFLPKLLCVRDYCEFCFLSDFLLSDVSVAGVQGTLKSFTWGTHRAQSKELRDEDPTMVSVYAWNSHLWSICWKRTVLSDNVA